MEKGTVSGIYEGIQRQVRNKFRRSLKEVQLSADEDKFVGNNMISSDDKTLLKLKQSKTVEKVIVSEKENVPAVRRSKRKTATEKVTYVESPVEFKPPKSKNTQVKKTVTKSKKSRSVVSKKNEQKSALNQSKLNFSPVTKSSTKEDPCASLSDDNLEKKLTTSAGNNEDSGFDPTCGVSGHSPMNSTVISRTPDVKNSSIIPYDISAITAGTPPLRYWKDLAEQRRMALESALHENELLHDQLAVLEAENNQLKQLLKEAENLAQVVRAIVD